MDKIIQIENLIFEYFLEDEETTRAIDNISLNIYPNPANNYVNLKVNGIEGNAKIIIYNEIGKQVQSIDVSSNLGIIEKQIDTKKFEKGVYLVKIISKGIETSEKLIIQ